MAFCTNCGQQVADGAKFCANCGTPITQSNTQTERKTVFDGEIHKCSHCGEILKAFETVCPFCKLEIRGAKSSSAVSELVRKIEELDRKKYDDSFIKSIKRKLDGTKLSPIEEQKISLISNFLIPNTKEDILEFMILSSSHILAKKPSGDISEHDELLYKELKKAWKMKFEQAYDKAKICIKNDEDRIEIEQCYNRTIIEPKKKTKKTTKIVLLSVFIPLILIVISIIVITKLVDGSTSNKNWDEIILNEYAPQPPMSSAEIMTNSREEFYIYDIKCSQREFYDYIDDCKQFGYDYEILEEDESSFEAYNLEGYKIKLTYILTLSVSLSAPMEMNSIEWPNSDIAKLIPQPQSLFGKISWQHDYGFVIYIGNTTLADYKEYVNLVYNSGFNVNYSKGDTYFWADNIDGYHVNITYEGFNTMFIRIDEPDEN